MDEQENLDLTDVGLYGEYILVIRSLGNGVIEREWLPAGLAVEDVLYNARNGRDIRSARIIWFDVIDDWSHSP